MRILRRYVIIELYSILSIMTGIILQSKFNIIQNFIEIIK